jgi:hypothetical protein
MVEEIIKQESYLIQVDVFLIAAHALESKVCWLPAINIISTFPDYASGTTPG